MLDKKAKYDKIYACWLGKNIGGTLGTPVEGCKEVMHLDWYPHLDPDGGALPNDDLDLQLLGLHAVEQYGVRLTAKDIAKEWTEHVYFPWDEYGYAGTAMRMGFTPPFSGMFDNAFTDCMGSPIRSEIWAGMCAGNPKLAAYFAWQDAVVDHAGGEGVFGEIFNAALEAAAYTNPHVEEIIEEALTYIPAECRVHRAVSHILALYRSGMPLSEAREALLSAHGRYNFTDAPQNIAFELCGLLWGSDFEDAILKVVNLGYDTDCTVATCGAIWGILHGTAGIPEKWSAPIGDAITVSAQIRGFRAPKNLAELTERTILAGKKLALEDTNRYVITYEDQHDFAVQHYTLPADADSHEAFLVDLRYPDGPVMAPACRIDLTLTNRTACRWLVRVHAEGTGIYTWSDDSADALIPCDVAPGETVRLSRTLLSACDGLPRVNTVNLYIERQNAGSLWTTYTIPFTILTPHRWYLNKQDTAVAGATVCFTEPAENGIYIAETILHTPIGRETLLFCNTEDAMRLELDGECILDAPAGLPFLPAYHRCPKEQRTTLQLAEGPHTLRITITAKKPPRFVFSTNAPAVVPEPGNFFSYIDNVCNLKLT